MTGKKHLGFLFSIGSNINPHQNVIKVLEHLLKQFPEIVISRVLKIPPVGMASQQDFLNLVVFIATDIELSALKSLFNKIETDLGRDRSDPNCKIKDRPADLDILLEVTSSADFRQPVEQITDEYFLYPLITELCAYLTGENQPAIQKGVTIQLGELTLGQTATTINRQTSGCYKRVIH